MLTPKETDILNFMRSYYLRHGLMPTLQEIGDALKIANRGNVSRYLNSMTQKGVLVRNQGHRGYAFIEATNTDAFSLPLAGRIAAGQPIEAIEGCDHINLYQTLLGEDRYLLRVDGNSMIDIGILPGDTVVMQNQETAKNGEIVCALIDGEEATLKRFFKNKPDIVELHPENTALKPMIFDASRVQIRGKLVAQFRLYK